ncbi:MAG TPA: YXWGXW repeat-containing protein [Pseudoduganella sp.]
MIKSKLVAAAALTLGLAAIAPTQALAQVGVSLVIGNAPPPPRFESLPPTRVGYVWAPGYWNWDGYRHVWVGGHWLPERQGYRYRPAEWVRVDNGWRLSQGGWATYDAPRYYNAPRYYEAPAPRPYYHNEYPRYYRDGRHRDRDHDGIPDRYDRDRDNDGIPNRYDRDRDGDGVPNRYDRRPDNPYRR